MFEELRKFSPIIIFFEIFSIASFLRENLVFSDFSGFWRLLDREFGGLDVRSWNLFVTTKHFLNVN